MLDGLAPAVPARRIFAVVGAYLRQNVDETPTYEASARLPSISLLSPAPLGASPSASPSSGPSPITCCSPGASFTQRFAGLTPSQALWSNTSA